MPKVRKGPPKVHRPQQQPKVPKPKAEHNEADQPVKRAKQNESLSETRALREGIDRGKWRKDDVETDYRRKRNNGHHHGQKKKLESLEAELNQILQEEIAQAEIEAQEAMLEEVKLEEVKQEQLQDTMEKDELEAYDEKGGLRKDEIEKDDSKAQELKATAPKEVKKSHSEATAKVHGVEIPRSEHKTTSFADILLDKDIESEVMEKKPIE